MCGLTFRGLESRGLFQLRFPTACKFTPSEDCAAQTKDRYILRFILASVLGRNCWGGLEAGDRREVDGGRARCNNVLCYAAPRRRIG